MLYANRAYTPPMQSAEIELKFPVSDPAALQATFPALGFELVTPRTFEHNILFDTADRALRSRHQILRLREYGERCIVTHKRQPEDADDSHYKTRIETETSIDDCAAMREIFLQLGYTPAFVYDKFRTEWSASISGSHAPAHLVLDETPIGTWAELEGPTAWIDTTLAALGINSATCLTDSYGKLFLAWKEQHQSEANDMTFEAVNLSLSRELALR